MSIPVGYQKSPISRGFFSIFHIPHSLFLTLFHLCNHPFKGLWFVLRKRGEDFAVNRNALYFQRVDEFAVGESKWPCRGVDADVPERAEVTLLVFAVVERIFTGVHKGIPCHTFLGGTAMAIPLGLFEQGLSELEGMYCFFDSGHSI